jgi:hypothetical protein
MPMIKTPALNRHYLSAERELLLNELFAGITHPMWRDY